jgi:hypothetical protein
MLCSAAKLRHNTHEADPGCGEIRVRRMLTGMAMGNVLKSGATLLAWVGLLGVSAARGQDLIPPVAAGGTVRLFPSDTAILESTDNRKDLPCTVNPDKPILGFDLKFHTGYEVTVPLKELAGTENQLTMVFHVTTDNRADDGVYFSQHFSVPAIGADESGPAYLQGTFNVGEGKYHIDWLMRDRAERMCSFHWDTEAALPGRDKQMALDIGPNAIQAVDAELFKQEPPVKRDSGDGPLNVKVMINFAPQDANSAAMRPVDASALLSILRSISREPRIVKFSIVAYNMQEQRIFYRQDGASQIDFPALGNAVKALRLGTVDFKHLSQKHSDTEFLTDLITKEVKETKDQPDAFIFAGPKVMVDDGLSPDTLKQLSDVKFPLFYMNYNLNPESNPWPDAIEKFVRFLKGVEYTISRPRDLFFDWAEIMGRIVKSKTGRIDTANIAAH